MEDHGVHSSKILSNPQPVSLKHISLIRLQVASVPLQVFVCFDQGYQFFFFVCSFLTIFYKAFIFNYPEWFFAGELIGLAVLLAL